MEAFSRHLTRGEINRHSTHRKSMHWCLQITIEYRCFTHTHSSDGVHKSNPGQWKLSLTEFPFAVLCYTKTGNRNAIRSWCKKYWDHGIDVTLYSLRKCFAKAITLTNKPTASTKTGQFTRSGTRKHTRNWVSRNGEKIQMLRRNHCRNKGCCERPWTCLRQREIHSTTRDKLHHSLLDKWLNCIYTFNLTAESTGVNIWMQMQLVLGNLWQQQRLWLYSVGIRCCLAEAGVWGEAGRHGNR